MKIKQSKVAECDSRNSIQMQANVAYGDDIQQIYYTYTCADSFEKHKHRHALCTSQHSDGFTHI